MSARTEAQARSRLRQVPAGRRLRPCWSWGGTPHVTAGNASPTGVVMACCGEACHTVQPEHPLTHWCPNCLLRVENRRSA